MRNAELSQQSRGRNIRARQSQEIVLRAGEFVLQLRHFLLGSVQHRPQLVSEAQLDAGALNLWALFQFRAQAVLQLIDGNARLLQQRTRHAIRLIEKSGKKMFIPDFLMIKLRCNILRSLQRLLHFLSEPVNAHASK